MSKINVRNFQNENEDGAPDLVGITTFSATSYFVPTKGTTAQRPPNHLEEGSIRFNTDTKNLEYYRGHTIGWAQFELIDPELGGGTGSNTGVGARGVFINGYITGSDSTNVLDFVTISTLGNATDFGDTTVKKQYQGGAASRTRGYSIGGESPGSPNGIASIDTFVFASTGNATDYGDLTQAAEFIMSFSDATRAVSNLGMIGGANKQNVLEYFNMASTGSAVDFGDMSYANYNGPTTQSSIRGFFMGGQDPASSPFYTDRISAITTSTLGSHVDWGDLLKDRSNIPAGFGNSTRGFCAGGADQPYTGDFNTIQFFSVVTAGNATDFGDLNTNFEYICGTSDTTRGLIAQGQTGGSPYNTIEFITMSTTGNARDFGDLTVARYGGKAVSNAHGGL
tara:strand:+ start:400 stop:1584 length:1185 start_codon:yes stop_codon:yes gene_type:complete